MQYIRRLCPGLRNTQRPPRWKSVTSNQFTKVSRSSVARLMQFGAIGIFGTI